MGPDPARPPGGIAYAIGVDVGQKVDPTAIVVAEAARTMTTAPGWVLPGRRGIYTGRQIHRGHAVSETVFTIRDLGRLPLGTPYPDVAMRIGVVLSGLRQRGAREPLVLIDVTGVGAPVFDLVRETVKATPCRLIACTFTHGDRLNLQRYSASVGKAHLVAQLQALLQTGRVKLPQTPEAKVLARELQDYEIRVSENANDTYGAFKVGTHDDLATALGLACLIDPIAERERYASWAF